LLKEGIAGAEQLQKNGAKFELTQASKIICSRK